MTQNWQNNYGIFPTIYVRILGLGSVALTLDVSGLGLLALRPLALITSLHSNDIIYMIPVAWESEPGIIYVDSAAQP